MSIFRGFIRSNISTQQCFNPAERVQVPPSTPIQVLSREFLLSRQWSLTTPTPTVQAATDLVNRVARNRLRGTKSGKNRRHAIPHISSFRQSMSNRGPGVNKNNLKIVSENLVHEQDKNLSFGLWNARSVQVAGSMCLHL